MLNFQKEITKYGDLLLFGDLLFCFEIISNDCVWFGTVDHITKLDGKELDYEVPFFHLVKISGEPSRVDFLELKKDVLEIEGVLKDMGFKFLHGFTKVPFSDSLCRLLNWPFDKTIDGLTFYKKEL